MRTTEPDGRNARKLKGQDPERPYKYATHFDTFMLEYLRLNIDNLNVDSWNMFVNSSKYRPSMQITCSY